MSRSEEAAELLSIAAASEKLAKKISRYAPLFPAADALPYLQHRFSNPHNAKVTARLGLRRGKFESGNEPRLPNLLCCFAADLKEQVERAKAHRAGKHGGRKIAGKYAARNSEIDQLIAESRINLGKVHPALIVAIMAVTTDAPVDESTVRKRAG